MLSGRHIWHLSGLLSRLLGSVGLAFALSMLFCTSVAWAHPSRPLQNNAITMQVYVGLNSTVRGNFWLPVQVTVTNSGDTHFSGKISIRTYSGLFSPTANDVASRQRFEQNVSVPSGKQGQFLLHIPFNVSLMSLHGVLVELFDANAKVIALKDQKVAVMNQSDLSIGVLSDNGSALNYLANLTLPNQTNAVFLTHLTARTFPTMSTVLANYDVIVLDDFTTRTLQPLQLMALQTWVNQGGILIEAGGSTWQQTLAPLPSSLLPVDVYNTVTLPAGTAMFTTGNRPIQGPGQSTPPRVLNVPLPVSFATLSTRGDRDQGSTLTSKIVLASNVTPLVVTAHQGQGLLCYLAFDPALPPLAGWPGISPLWSQLLLRTLGDSLLISSLAPRFSSGPGSLGIRQGLLAILQPDVWSAPWILVLLLFGYVALLGPARLLLVRKLKRPYWNWRIMLSGVVIFSLLSYGLAFYQKGSSLIDNSISMVQINQGGTTSHITTYMGVYVPNQGDFRVRFPGAHLAQAVSVSPNTINTFMTMGDSSTPVLYGAHETDVNLLNSGLWTFHPIVSEQDRSLRGTIDTHLALRNHRLVGTIKNTLTTLSDVYVLMPHSFVAIGQLPAGETQKIDLALQSSTSTSTALSDLIAQHGGLAASYDPYENGGKPQTDFQRHVALLSALNGAGYSFTPCDGSCNTNAIVNVNKQSIITLRPGVPNLPWSDIHDPLLLDGAPATLIGWADQSLDGMNNVTVNGSVPRGFHESFIQMPLNVGIDTPVNLPPDFITGHVVASQGYDNEAVLPDTYFMAPGSMNFEFDLSSILARSELSRFRGLTITIPNALDNAPLLTGTNYLHVGLYNWQNDTWDTFSLNQYALTTPRLRTYIGPYGQVLLQVANQRLPSMQGSILLGRPSLAFN